MSSTGPVDLRKPEPPSSASTGAHLAAPPGSAPRAGRFWSVRRIPAGIVAAITLGAVGLLLYDVVSVRAGQPGMYWRRKLAEELATRPLDDGWVIGGASVAMALGLWLLVLALTPGLRRVLPIRRDTADLRAGLDRPAAGMVLRDRAMEVSGVRSVRVAVGRHRARARVQAHFRDLAEVRSDVEAALTEGIRQLGLARPLRLSLQVSRPPKKKR
ncbi:DUF6286 domain-containing protein [Streptomyces palmae]|uniref:DUF6286 domain-containing protein n=1 Tax=Streptomyces palmae TaxID=1701085 RepID=UPI001ADF761B|nr:DUF6286 domain-containing protein [Streptomyces palmae]